MTGAWGELPKGQLGSVDAEPQQTHNCNVPPGEGASLQPWRAVCDLLPQALSAYLALLFPADLCSKRPALSQHTQHFHSKIGPHCGQGRGHLTVLTDLALPGACISGRALVTRPQASSVPGLGS